MSSLSLVPRTDGPGPDDTLAAVHELLADRLADLSREWHDGASSADAMLGDDDVPELLAALTLGGGKRFRPILCHWGWVAAGGVERDADPAPMVRLGAALELLHAFALAQDDVMDASPTRRGRPTVHVVARERHAGSGGRDDAVRFGDSVAVLVGDLGHAEADALVAGLDAGVRRLWWRTCVELVRGQARDLSDAASGGGPGAYDRAVEVARAKSGAYTVQRPLELGATAAGGSPAALAALGGYGRHLGEAFALRDDLLGVWGDPVVTGKPAADDLRSGKSTVLLALAERRLDGAAARSVARLRDQTHDEHDVETVMTAMVASGVRDRVEGLVEERVRSAIDALRSEPHGRPVLTAEAVAGLEAVATEIAWRQR